MAKQRFKPTRWEQLPEQLRSYFLTDAAQRLRRRRGWWTTWIVCESGRVVEVAMNRSDHWYISAGGLQSPKVKA